MKSLEDLGYIKTSENDKRIIYKKEKDYVKSFLGVTGKLEIIIILKSNGNVFLRKYLKYGDRKEYEPFCINSELWSAITKVSKEYEEKYKKWRQEYYNN